jgi:hypothetical protein
VCKVIHLLLESSDPFHRALSLVNPITDVLLQRSIPVRVPGSGGGSGSEARLGVDVSGGGGGSNYHPHGAPSSHPHSQCPTGAPEGEPAVLLRSTMLPPYELTSECDVVL